jgi:2'-hydroxyisoflavone reductase
MRILVIGGSVFLGRAVVEEALALGAQVTVFNRGRSGRAPDGVEQLVGDRTSAADLAQLQGREFDVVVDTCGFVPADVAASAQVLAPSTGRYAFVSSVNAWPGWPEDPDYRAAGPYAGQPDATRADLPSGLDPAQAYGWLKFGCERAVRRAFGDGRSAVLRAGAIVGPHDSATGRLPWWIDRIARGGEVLVPGHPADPIALIDARDLARFACSSAVGVFEAGGPDARDTWGDLLAACAAATGSSPRFVQVDSEWLAGEGVGFWTELPLWIPQSLGPGLWRHDGAPAAAAGLRWRPLAETVADTWAWQQAVEGGWRPTAATPGLAPEREVELLAAWASR